MNTTAPSRVRLEIDLAAVERNFRHISATVRPARVMAVLKADAYGLGARPIAKRLERSGADRIGVAEIKEALALKGEVRIPVQILGGLLPAEVEPAVREGFICPVSDLETARLLSREAKRQGRTVKVHVKVDTGMGRLGFPAATALDSIRRALELPGLEAEGLYSHFSNANNPRHAKSRDQLHRFNGLLEALRAEGFTFPIIHMANSDGINNFPESYFNLVRTGINLYGVFDLEGLRRYRLSRTLSLRTSLLSRRRLPAGHTIGYGDTHTLFRETWVGTVPIGYADGLPLAASNSGEVLIRGRACRIIGRVSMDYITVDLSDCPKARAGDEVLVVGKRGMREITIEDWARVKQTHPYDIICSLGPRVERAYRGETGAEKPPRPAKSRAGSTTPGNKR